MRNPFAFIGRLFAARRSREDREPEDRRIPYTGRSLAGVYVTPDMALRHDVVWACWRYLRETVAQCDVRVQRWKPDGSYEWVPAHPVDTVLAWRSNPELAPFQLKETLVGWAVLWGNGYAEIERDMSGRVIALWPVHPSRVEVRRRLDTGALFYEVDNGVGGSVEIEPMNMFHLRGFGDGAVGLSVVEYAAESIGWAQATQLFGAAFFGEGMNPSGVVEVSGKMAPEAMKRLRAEFEALYKGPRKSNKVAFLDGGMKWTKLSASPNDAQFVATMQHQVETVCRWFGVPPHKVQHMLRSTFSNIEHQSIEVVVDSITPWVKRFEEEANYKLFGQNRAGFRIKFDLRSLLRGDAKARGEYYRLMSDIGVYSVDDVRILEDENPIGPEKGGDKRLVQMNRTTLDKIGEDQEPTPPAGKNSGPPMDDEEEPDAEDPAPAPPVAALYELTDERRRLLAALETVQ